MRKKESGAVLIVSLIILIALTLFVLSGTHTVMMQEKMTSAVRDMHVSLEIAVSGIIDAEAYVDSLANTSTFNNTGASGLYSEGNGPSDLFANATWAAGFVRLSSIDVSGGGVKANYFIEYMGKRTVSVGNPSVAIGENSSSTSSVDIFKIVSRSAGRSGNTERIIVTYYAKNL